MGEREGEEMKRITVIYSGWIDKTLDNEVRAANERDLRFELPLDEDIK